MIEAIVEKTLVLAVIAGASSFACAQGIEWLKLESEAMTLARTGRSSAGVGQRRAHLRCRVGGLISYREAACDRKAELAL
jgi:hypothetical protein